VSSRRNEKLIARLRSASKSTHEAVQDLLKQGETEAASKLSVAVQTIDRILRMQDLRK
jgi:hypothetical protein